MEISGHPIGNGVQVTFYFQAVDMHFIERGLVGRLLDFLLLELGGDLGDCGLDLLKLLVVLLKHLFILVHQILKIPVHRINGPLNLMILQVQPLRVRLNQVAERLSLLTRRYRHLLCDIDPLSHQRILLCDLIVQLLHLLLDPVLARQKFQQLRHFIILRPELSLKLRHLSPHRGNHLEILDDFLSQGQEVLHCQLSDIALCRQFQQSIIHAAAHFTVFGSVISIQLEGLGETTQYTLPINPQALLHLLHRLRQFPINHLLFLLIALLSG